MNPVHIELLEEDLSQETVRQKLISYLEPHETQALFLLGNIQNNLQPSILYGAYKDKCLIGVCGFYPTFHSCTIFSENPEASRRFARVVLKNHPSVDALLGMASMVKPAYEEFVAQGKKLTTNPENIFFELSMENFKPFTSADGIIRSPKEQDADRVARLLRLIHNVQADLPLTEEELQRVKACPMVFCLEIDGKVVAVASSNGLAIKAFQLLGVATDPAFRRKGYAKAVCSHLIRAMQAKGATKAVIFTGEENVAAKKCYLDLGFQITDRYYVGLFEPVRNA